MQYFHKIISQKKKPKKNGIQIQKVLFYAYALAIFMEFEAFALHLVLFSRFVHCFSWHIVILAFSAVVIHVSGYARSNSNRI